MWLVKVTAFVAYLEYKEPFPLLGNNSSGCRQEDLIPCQPLHSFSSTEQVAA